MKIKRLIISNRFACVQKIVLISAILLCGVNVSAQTDEITLNAIFNDAGNNSKKASDSNLIKVEKSAVKETKEFQKTVLEITKLKLEKSRFEFTDSKSRQTADENFDIEPDVKNVQTEKIPSQPINKENFHWKPALIQSGIFLGIQHGFRMTQDKTTRELGGPFFRDWGRSIRNLRGWGDGDGIFTNYVAHPLQGAATGRIFVNNSDFAKKQEFGKSKAYWESRFKAMAWSAVWSAQFELGPVSEASIGNVGLNKVRGHSTMAYVDLVVTPVVGTGVLIGEDAIDKYVLKNWLERKVGDKNTLKLLRSVLTPTTSVTNLLRGKMPWKRDNRLL